MYGIDAEETAEVLGQDPGHQPAADLIRQMAARIADLEAKEGAGEATARLLGCGWCYEEQGEEVHPHPECPIRGTAAPVVVPAADRAALRDRIAEAIADALKPRYGGPQHNTPGGLPLTATAEQIRLHRAQPLADAVLSVLPAPADRATVLEEAAAAVAALDPAEAALAGQHAWSDAAALLRRMAVESAVVDRVAAETPPAETQAELQVWPLRRILTEVRCGSKDWSWEEEWADLARRHAETGYLDRLADQISENGITMPVLVGTDGRLWDGHHRLCIAVRLGIGYVPVEVVRPVVEAQPGKDTETPQPKEA